MTDVQRASAHVAIECDELADSFRCLICLEDLAEEAASKALRCAHLVCNDCQRDFWTHSVEKESEAFPSCALRGCDAHASYRELAALLPAPVMRRVRQLQALKPTRAIDGRPMYCVRPGCLEPLPPAPALPDEHVRDENNDGDNNGGDDPGDDLTAGLVSTCPECLQQACLRCGAAAHPDTICARPLATERETRLYRQYAIGRVGACPRCGVHIVRDGGCTLVSCSRCAFQFQFTAFRNVDEVVDAAADIPENDPAVGAPRRPPPGTAMYFMFWGAGFSSVPMTIMYQNVKSGEHLITLLFLVPFICLGVPIFFLACAAYLHFLYDEIMPLFGRPGAVDAHRAAGMLVMAGAFILMAMFLTRSFVPVSSWVALVYLPPFVLFPVFLVAFLLLHFAVVAVRALRGGPRWERVEDGGGEGEGDETGEDVIGN